MQGESKRLLEDLEEGYRDFLVHLCTCVLVTCRACVNKDLPAYQKYKAELEEDFFHAT
jgi:hypothetical protein